MHYVEINPGIPKFRYLWMSSKPVLLKRVFVCSILLTQPAFVCSILLTQLCGSLALFRHTEQPAQPCHGWVSVQSRLPRGRVPRAVKDFDNPGALDLWETGFCTEQLNLVRVRWGLLKQ